MNIIFIGCVESSRVLLKQVLQHDEAQVTGIITKSASPANADFYSLSGLAAEHNIPCHEFEPGQDAAMLDWIRTCKADVIYCFGWSHLLSAAVLDSTRLGVIGYHPAALPQNRGRHPIIWALALGLTETASTFFFMDEGADSGDILDQIPVAIELDDNAQSLYDKLMVTARDQIMQFTSELASNNYTRTPQDHSQANSWRRRGKADGKIDWRMPAQGIYNLVRALSSPYPGAHCYYQDKEIKVWKARVVTDVADNLEPGKVLDANSNRLVVKCGIDALALLDHEFTELPEQGQYL